MSYRLCAAVTTREVTLELTHYSRSGVAAIVEPRRAFPRGAGCEHTSGRRQIEGTGQFQRRAAWFPRRGRADTGDVGRALGDQPAWYLRSRAWGATASLPRDGPPPG